MRYDIYPTNLIEETKKGNLVPFIGAGISIPCGGPSWSTLQKDLLLSLGDPFDNLKVSNKILSFSTNNLLQNNDVEIIESSLISSIDPLMSAQIFQNRFGRNTLLQLLLGYMKKINQPNRVHSLLIEVGAKAFVTTNYDNLIEVALNNAGINHGLIVNEKDCAYISSDDYFVLKMHGSLKDRKDVDSVVISKEDYENYDISHPIISLILQYLFSMKTIMLLGYSGRDPNFNFLYDRVKTYFGKHKRYSYLVLFDAKEDVLDYYKNLGLYPINLDGKNKTQSLIDWLEELKLRI